MNCVIYVTFRSLLYLLVVLCFSCLFKANTPIETVVRMSLHTIAFGTFTYKSKCKKYKTVPIWKNFQACKRNMLVCKHKNEWISFDEAFKNNRNFFGIFESKIIFSQNQLYEQ